MERLDFLPSDTDLIKNYKCFIVIFLTTILHKIIHCQHKNTLALTYNIIHFLFQ